MIEWKNCIPQKSTLYILNLKQIKYQVLINCQQHLGKLLSHSLAVIDRFFPSWGYFKQYRCFIFVSSLKLFSYFCSSFVCILQYWAIYSTSTSTSQILYFEGIVKFNWFCVALKFIADHPFLPRRPLRCYIQGWCLGPPQEWIESS